MTNLGHREPDIGLLVNWERGEGQEPLRNSEILQRLWSTGEVHRMGSVV